ncbi:MAG: response regulator, partial [Campylobacterales bacterium]
MIKILYLEDDINLSETIEEFLEDNDFDVDVSYNGKDALNKLYKSNFDVLIFDVNLPDINGFELVQKLRDSDIYTPVIFTTTLNDIDSLDKGYEVGADDYLRKP